jgi:hypothetical protein
MTGQRHRPTRRPVGVQHPGWRAGTGGPGIGQARRTGSSCSLGTSTRLQQTSAHATSTNANHRPEPRSHRTCSRRKQLSHDSDRSTFQRWRRSRVDDSTSRRAIRDLIPRRRR